MSKFKVGDKVRAVSASRSWGRVKAGDVGIVSHVIKSALRVDFPKHYRWLCGEEDLELAEDTSKYHKHHDLIIQWAKGAEIEYYSTTFDRWLPADNPCWDKDEEYRIKPPVPKTDKERIAELEARVEELENKV